MISAAMASARACWAGVGDTLSLSQPGSCTSAHCIKYKCCMTNAVMLPPISGGGSRRRCPPQAAAFARDVIAQAAPEGRERAKNLLWAAGKLADYAASAGPGPRPGGGAAPVGGRAVHPVRAGAVRRGAPHAAHEPAVHRPPGRAAAVSGGSAAAPGAGRKSRTAAAEIDGYLALADAQPTAGAADARGRAGLPGRGRRADPRRPARRARQRRRLPVRRRRGAPCAAPRPRTVPVLARYHGPLLAAARFAGTGLICGGADPGRRNLTNPLITALDGGTGLPRLDTSRLRATWLADCAEPARPGHVHARRRDQLLPAARRPGRRAGAGRRGRGGPAARGRPAMIPLAAFEEVIDASGVAPRIEAMLPVGVRARQLKVRTLLAGHVPGPGRSPARAPDPGAPGPDRPARRRPAAARRDRGLGNTARTC